jgi:C-terminal processing protease CtpA/Prc
MTSYELDTEEFVGSFRASVGYGLLIIRDSNSTETHADWEGSDIHVTRDSIYLCVQHPVDGPVTVEVFEGPPAREDGFVWFDGVIVSAGGTFIVHDPDEDVRLVVRTDHPGEVRLRIASDVELLSTSVRRASDVELLPTSVRLNFWY